MKSLMQLYKVGKGPSSSHTMGPDIAAKKILEMFPDADEFSVTLFGSLALTGRGHMTDEALLDALGRDRTKIILDTDTPTDSLPHPNTLDFYAYKDGVLIGKQRAMSVGGGAVEYEGLPSEDPPEVYEHNSFEEISEYCSKKGIRLWQYAEEYEGRAITEYLLDIWECMKNAISEGLAKTGELPGGLGTQRKARFLFNQRHIDESAQTKENRLVCAYAFAVSEQNAGGGIIVTAPTCGSCGVVPSVLRYMQEQKGFSDIQVAHALAAGGIIGNLIKTNASISGAECGCQAEVGAACSMAAAALAELFEMGIDQIEYAAEVAMEHHLGLTCDPIGGLVQIPCIERNAVAGMRAINALSLSNFLTTTRKISFDTVVQTMYETGLDMSGRYKETSRGGLAVNYNNGGCGKCKK